MQHSQISPSASPRVIPVNVYENARRAPVWEQAFYTIWMFSIFMPIDAFQPLRLVCIAGLLAMLAIYRGEIVPLLLKAWPLFPLPLFAALSVLWTPFPGDAPRGALLLLLTPVLLVVLAARLRTIEFLRVVMFAAWLGTLYCIPYYETLHIGEPYDGKNSLAFHMLITILVSLGTLLNEDEPVLIRLIAGAFIPVAFHFQYLAESATSLVFALVGSALLIMVKLVWTGASKVRHVRSAALAFLTAGALVVAMVLLSMPNTSFVLDFLGFVGKDTTLTGRTALWEAAERVSAENPWFGVGFDGFWNPATGIAQTLNENDYKPFGTALTFHNAFWEARVHFGLVGLALFILAMSWAGLRLIAFWLQDGSVTSSILLVMYTVIFISCFTESYALGPSSMMVYFLYIGGLASLRIGERKYVGVGRLVERPA